MTDERASVSNRIGDAKAGAEGILDQTADAVQNAYSKTVDAAAEGAQAAKEAAIAGRDLLQDFVEEHPYTTVALAFGMGLLIGLTSSQSSQRRSWWN